MPWPWKSKHPGDRTGQAGIARSDTTDALSALERIHRAVGVTAAVYGWWPEGSWSPLLAIRGEPTSRLPATLDAAEAMSWISPVQSMRLVLLEEVQGGKVQRRARALIPLVQRGGVTGLLVLERGERAFTTAELDVHAALFGQLTSQVASLRTEQELHRGRKTLRWMSAIVESKPGSPLDTTLARALRDLLDASWVLVVRREGWHASVTRPAWLEVLDEGGRRAEAWPNLLGPAGETLRWSGDAAGLTPEERGLLERLGQTREVHRLSSTQGKILVGWASGTPVGSLHREQVREVLRTWELAARAEPGERNAFEEDSRDSQEREALDEAARARGTLARLQASTVAVEEALRDLASQAGLPPEIRQRLSALVGPLHVLRGKLDDLPAPGANCRIQDVLKGLQSWLVQLTQQHQVHLATEFQTDLPLPVDPERAALLVSTLLENAIRFSRPGGRVRLWVIQGESHVRVMVSDSGIGIPAACQPRIGERGYQVDPSRGGTGMGLARLREVLERVGGTIGFSSREGSGSTFHVTLPLTATREFHASHPS